MGFASTECKDVGFPSLSSSSLKHTHTTHTNRQFTLLRLKIESLTAPLFRMERDPPPRRKPEKGSERKQQRAPRRRRLRCPKAAEKVSNTLYYKALSGFFSFLCFFFFFSIESWPRRVRRRKSEEEVSSASLFRHRMRRGPRADKYQPLSLFRHKSQRAARREAAEEGGSSRSPPTHGSQNAHASTHVQLVRRNPKPSRQRPSSHRRRNPPLSPEPRAHLSRPHCCSDRDLFIPHPPDVVSFLLFPPLPLLSFCPSLL